MKIGSIMVNAAYLGSKVLTAIAVGATKVWEGVSKYIKFADPRGGAAMHEVEQ